MFFLSWRQLMSRKKQTFLILLGISFGTLLFVSISGVQLGMREYISGELLNNTSHILISGSEQTIEPLGVTEALYPHDQPVIWITPPAGKRQEVRLQNYQGWVTLLDNDPLVYDYSPRLRTNILLLHAQFSASVSVVGVIPEKHMRISHVERYLRDGNFSSLKSGGNNIVIGSGVQSKLGIRLNQIINVSAGKSSVRPYKVVGIIHFGNEQIDENIAFAHLNNVQVMAKNPGRVSEIAVSLLDIDNAVSVAGHWRSFSKDKVQDWQQANKSFMEVIRVQDFTRYFITTAILIVAAFGIYNVLTIMINQKRREIAILRAIGYGPKKILQLILYQGLVLGISGGVLGLLLGYLMLLWVGSIDFGFEIGGSHNLRISYDWSIYVIAFVTANLSSLVASYIPAWEASRMTPMEIIRSES